MKRIGATVKNYLSRPEVGAGLLFVALAAGILKLWLTRLIVSGPTEFFTTAGPDVLLLAWTTVSFGVSAWLAFLLLRRRLGQRALQRVLLVAAVHAAGAIRFYDWGMMLLSVLPLFALLPALLLPVSERKT